MTVRALVRDAACFFQGLAKTLLFVYAPVLAVLALIHFPRDVDLSTRTNHRTPPKAVRAASFYEAAYDTNRPRNRGLDYGEMAQHAARINDIEAKVRRFVAANNLQGKRVLEVGSGSGALQDIVEDYTGLDLSPTVASRYHKPFLAASATNMPFADQSFDAIWSIWVLEHVPEPERALLEMRRVLKPDGLLYLAPAWNCTSWAADGFEVRPYSDFNWRGKLVKASTIIRRSPYFALLHRAPIRLIRRSQYAIFGADEPLRFRALEPNYETYWESDSDAAISLDRYEAYLWFRAHGDACANCGSPVYDFLDWTDPLILQIRK